MNTRTSGFGIAEVVLILVIVVIIGAIVFPMFARCPHPAPGSCCESNMQQIGKAFKQYLSDWDDTFPTNRNWISKGKLGPISARVKLSPAKRDKDGNPIRFRHGINWVEGLYSHLEAVTSSRDDSSVWRCSRASTNTYPTDSDTAAVSYVFNHNLAEKREGVIRGSANLMLMREMDRCVDATLRPTNDSTGKPSERPVSPFLTAYDAKLGRTEPSLHTNGSHVLFADCHVKYYEHTYFPSQSHLTRKSCWDSKAGQWYNYAHSAKRPWQYEKSIAITP